MSKKAVVKAPEAGQFLASLDGATMGELMKIEREIFKIRDKVVEVAAKGYLRIGALLSEARNALEGDEQFGKWRAERLPDISMHQASAMMRAHDVASQAPDLIEACSLSVLQEVAYGGPRLVEWAKQRIAAGEPVTVKAVREERNGPPPGWGGGGKEEKASKVITDDKEPEVIKGVGRPLAATGPAPDPQKRYKEVLRLDLHKRLEKVYDGFTNESHVKCGYLILGIDPDPSCPMNPEVFDAVVKHFDEELKGEYEDINQEAWIKLVIAAATDDQKTGF